MTGCGPAIEEFAGYLGLAIERVTGLPDHWAGMLDSRPDPRFIAVNANLPRCEQVFTIAHEIGHCIRDHQRQRRRFCHWLLDRECTTRPGRLYVRLLRALVARSFSRETEANLIAVSIMVRLGLAADIRAYLDRHPEQAWMFIYVGAHQWVKHPLRSARGLWRSIGQAAPAG